MLLQGTGVALISIGLILYVVEGGKVGHQEVIQGPADKHDGMAGCPEYARYAAYPHRPLGDGLMALPYQRPWPDCRTFSSQYVEKVIEEITSRMEDKDLSRLFENAFPNTVDTTVRWHVNGTEKRSGTRNGHSYGWEGAQSFIVTGDIDAEWLRDSTNQLEQYHALARKDEKIHNLILGAINTQAEFVIASPYCNAFQPPPPSHLPVTVRPVDTVHPAYDPGAVFECKYELDSLAHFLALSSKFYNSTGSTAFLTSRWYTALNAVLDVLDQQAMPTFDNSSGSFIPNAYTFQRLTSLGTETLSLGGNGNPLNWGTNLVRSAFRPSDDATILGFYIPANAMMAVQLKRTAEIVRKAGKIDLANNLYNRGVTIEEAIWEHGVVSHKKYGSVFAYEVDGYGSSIIMDDANLPSLLSLPKLGFVDSSDETYQNTRKMLLSKEGNPYYLKGRSFHGIGGPHVGLRNAWPMSLLVQAMTSDDDEEIMETLKLVKSASRLGLIHESIDVNILSSYTRSWFAWANSLYSVVILDLAHRKPHLLFGKGAEPYVIG